MESILIFFFLPFAFLKSCLSGDDSSTCIVISAKDVEIVASSDSSITSKARGSNKVRSVGEDGSAYSFQSHQLSVSIF